MQYTIEPTRLEKCFINAYFEAVQFTETGDIGQPETGADLDADFERESIIDCLAFYNRICCYISTDKTEQAGHDFWFTRNRHGTGFWDRPEVYGDLISQKFTEWAQSFGEPNPVWDECHNLPE